MYHLMGIIGECCNEESVGIGYRLGHKNNKAYMDVKNVLVMRQALDSTVDKDENHQPFAPPSKCRFRRNDDCKYATCWLNYLMGLVLATWPTMNLEL
jgi:hypothetical protein